MGCTGCRVGVDPEITKLIASLDTKIEEYDKTFNEEAEKAKKAQEEQLKNRKKELTELKEKNEEITEKKIRELNKEELKVEIELLSNAVDKMHYIFSVGLEIAEPIRKITIDKLMEKAKSAPAITVNKINSEIAEVKKFPIIDFIDSTYGKVLKDALEKKGMSATVLKGVKNDLFKERQKRRKAEKEEFNIKVNEFDDENIDNIKLDLFDLIKKEYKDINKHFRDFCRDKIVEGMCEINKGFAED